MVPSYNKFVSSPHNLVLVVFLETYRKAVMEKFDVNNAADVIPEAPAQQQDRADDSEASKLASLINLSKCRFELSRPDRFNLLKFIHKVVNFDYISLSSFLNDLYCITPSCRDFVDHIIKVSIVLSSSINRIITFFQDLNARYLQTFTNVCNADVLANITDTVVMELIIDFVSATPDELIQFSSKTHYKLKKFSVANSLSPEIIALACSGTVTSYNSSSGMSLFKRARSLKFLKSRNIFRELKLFLVYLEQVPSDCNSVIRIKNSGKFAHIEAVIKNKHLLLQNANLTDILDQIETVYNNLMRVRTLNPSSNKLVHKTALESITPKYSFSMQYKNEKVRDINDRYLEAKNVYNIHDIRDFYQKVMYKAFVVSKVNHQYFDIKTFTDTIKYQLAASTLPAVRLNHQWNVFDVFNSGNFNKNSYLQLEELFLNLSLTVERNDVMDVLLFKTCISYWLDVNLKRFSHYLDVNDVMFIDEFNQDCELQSILKFMQCELMARSSRFNELGILLDEAGAASNQMSNMGAIRRNKNTVVSPETAQHDHLSEYSCLLNASFCFKKLDYRMVDMFVNYARNCNASVDLYLLLIRVQMYFLMGLSSMTEKICKKVLCDYAKGASVNEIPIESSASDREEREESNIEERVKQYEPIYNTKLKFYSEDQLIMAFLIFYFDFLMFNENYDAIVDFFEQHSHDRIKDKLYTINYYCDLAKAYKEKNTNEICKSLEKITSFLYYNNKNYNSSSLVRMYYSILAMYHHGEFIQPLKLMTIMVIKFNKKMANIEPDSSLLLQLQNYFFMVKATVLCLRTYKKLNSVNQMMIMFDEVVKRDELCGVYCGISRYREIISG